MRIIYFDGICTLCNSFIDFVVKRDTQNLFHIASLQGLTAKNNLPARDLSLDSVVYVEDGKIYRQSDAVLRIFQHLGAGYKIIAAIGHILPRFLRDGIYNLIAKNRYQLFGKKDTCRLPTLAERKKFLD